MNETIKSNFDNLAATIKCMFMFRQDSIRNLNLMQEEWFANTYVLSKLWYMSQVVPPENAQIARLKTALESFLWADHLYRVERKQLWLSKARGGQRSSHCRTR
jgi:hypothetical protein